MTERTDYFKPFADLTPANQKQRLIALAKYRDVMKGKRLTSPQIASKLGYTTTGTTTMLYRMEKRGIVSRVGHAPRPKAQRMYGRPAVIWVWVGGPEAGE